MTESANEQKVDRRVAKTRKAISEALKKLIAEKGIDKVTVSALAREADIDRKTFYLHFSSIDELIRKEAEDLVDQLVTAVFAEEMPGEDHLGMRLKAMIVELANITKKNPEMYRRLIKSFSLEQMVDALYAPVSRIAIEHDELLAQVDGEVAEFIVRFYLAGALSVFTHWFVNEAHAPIETVVDLVENVVASSPALPPRP